MTWTSDAGPCRRSLGGYHNLCLGGCPGPGRVRGLGHSHGCCDLLCDHNRSRPRDPDVGLACRSTTMAKLLHLRTCDVSTSANATKRREKANEALSRAVRTRGENSGKGFVGFPVTRRGRCPLRAVESRVSGAWAAANPLEARQLSVWAPSRRHDLSSVFAPTAALPTCLENSPGRIRAIDAWHLSNCLNFGYLSVPRLPEHALFVLAGMETRQGLEGVRTCDLGASCSRPFTALTVYGRPLPHITPPLSLPHANTVRNELSRSNRRIDCSNATRTSSP